MEQFSRVMTTMTGDVSATNEALAETTEIVSGTAYGLDYACLLYTSRCVSETGARARTGTQRARPC